MPARRPRRTYAGAAVVNAMLKSCAPQLRRSSPSASCPTSLSRTWRCGGGSSRLAALPEACLDDEAVPLLDSSPEGEDSANGLAWTLLHSLRRRRPGPCWRRLTIGRRGLCFCGVVRTPVHRLVTTRSHRPDSGAGEPPGVTGSRVAGGHHEVTRSALSGGCCSPWAVPILSSERAVRRSRGPTRFSPR